MNDHRLENNPGRARALEAAAAVNGVAIFPELEIGLRARDADGWPPHWGLSYCFLRGCAGRCARALFDQPNDGARSYECAFYLRRVLESAPELNFSASEAR